MSAEPRNDGYTIKVEPAKKDDGTGLFIVGVFGQLAAVLLALASWLFGF